MTTQRFLMAFVIAAACAVPASATLTTYSSLASLQAAVPGDTFSNIAFAQGSLGTSTTADGVMFSTTGLDLTGGANPSGWPAGPAQPALVNTPNGANSTVSVSVAAAVNAIEFYVGPQDFTAFNIAVTDNAGGSFNSGAFIQSSLSTPEFFGVVTTGSFTSLSVITFTSVDKTTIDAMQVGEAAPTPEVASFLLVGSGLFLMGYWRRRAAGAAAAPKGSRGAIRPAMA